MFHPFNFGVMNNKPTGRRLKKDSRRRKMMNVKALVFQKRPFYKVDSILTSQGFTKVGVGPSLNYRAALRDSSTESIYYLEIPVDQIESHVKIGKPYLYGEKRIPEPVRMAAESKLYEIADYLKNTKKNGHMAQSEKDIKRLGKEMESMETNKELHEKGWVPDPIQYEL
jgi:hypothetical protein